MADQTPEQRRAWEAGNAKISAIIRPMTQALYETDMFMHNFDERLLDLAADYGGLDMNPEYQRGHVWSREQQVHFVENMLRGIVSTAGFVVQFNCPNWDNDKYAGDLPKGFQCVDGLQRTTAISEWVKGNIMPFGLSLTDIQGTTFMPKNNTRYRFKVAFYAFQTRQEIIQHYLDLNCGGTPHSPEEIARVRGLLADIKQNS